MSLKVQVVPVTPYQQNCSIIQCQASGLAAIVDPGGDIERIEAAISQMDARVEKILLTHGHLDHCAAADVLRQKLTVPMEGPEQGDSFWIDKLPEWCEMAGFPKAEPFTPDRWLEHGDTVTVGEQTLEVIHCPGHTPGHVSIHIRSGGQEALITGDCIHHPCQMSRTDWCSSADADQAQGRRTREDLLARYADGDVLVIGTHFATPTAGRVRTRAAGGYWLDVD